MSTALASGAPTGALPTIPADSRVAIITAEWNSHITFALRDGARDILASQGVVCHEFTVPGAVELTYAAAALMDRFDAIIVIGCVVRGGTPHFDYVCQSVTRGITELNAQGRTPVIFGVLTVDTEQDAIDRAGGSLGNKGSEAAEAAIRMIDYTCIIKN